jgi:chemotaxis protein MotB
VESSRLSPSRGMRHAVRMRVEPTPMRERNRFALVGALLLSPLPACVSKGLYDAAVTDAQGAHAKLASSEQAREAEEADLRRQLADAQQKSQDLDQKVSDLSTANHNLQAKLDESTAISAQLRGELERLGKNVDAMLQEKGTLSHALEDAKTRLEELRRAQAAADARTQLFKQFLRKLKSMIDAGQLRVVMRAGRLVIQLPNDVLFGLFRVSGGSGMAGTTG